MVRGDLGRWVTQILLSTFILLIDTYSALLVAVPHHGRVAGGGAAGGGCCGVRPHLGGCQTVAPDAGATLRRVSLSHN